MLVKADGSQTRTIYRRPPVRTAGSGFYIWRSGDRIDRVANWALGDPQLAWRILDVNPEILNAHSITPGTRIRLP
jgi:hypothetical protein